MSRNRHHCFLGDAGDVIPDQLKKRGSQAELYDLANDPGEKRNLAATRPELVKELAALLEQVQGSN